MGSNSTADFLKIAAVLGFIGVAVWWLESRFDSLVAVIVIGGLFGVFFFAGGALLSHATMKAVLEQLTKFNQGDAQTDRYRMDSFKAMAQGQSALQKAMAQLTVIDAKRVDKLASQQAKMLTDTERVKWDMQKQAKQPQNATWSWDDDDANGEEFAGWG